MLFQTITTRHLAPTNKRGARFKATTSMGITVTIEDQVGRFDGHYEALLALVNKLGWYATWHAGAIDKRGSCVWVRESESVKISAPEPTMSLDALR
jgi:hypothetical protein